jgi:hypothetical protein
MHARFEQWPLPYRQNACENTRDEKCQEGAGQSGQKSFPGRHMPEPHRPKNGQHHTAFNEVAFADDDTGLVQPHPMPSGLINESADGAVELEQGHQEEGRKLDKICVVSASGNPYSYRLTRFPDEKFTLPPILRRTAFYWSDGLEPGLGSRDFGEG